MIDHVRVGNTSLGEADSAQPIIRRRHVEDAVNIELNRNLIEAAELDGASGWKQFTDITIPMIRPTLVVVLTTIMIATLKLYDIIAATTGGNYNTSVLSFEMS